MIYCKDVLSSHMVVKLMFSNILKRKSPSFEEIFVNIFIMHKYAKKNVLGPVLFMCYYWKLSNQ